MADTKERSYVAVTVPTELKDELQAMADFVSKDTGLKCSPANLIEIMKQEALKSVEFRKRVGQ